MRLRPRVGLRDGREPTKDAGAQRSHQLDLPRHHGDESRGTPDGALGLVDLVVPTREPCAPTPQVGPGTVDPVIEPDDRRPGLG